MRTIMDMPIEGRKLYAGFWPRLLAFARDYALILPYLVLLVVAGATIRSIFPDAVSKLFGSPWSGELSGFLLVTLPISLYFALSEASPRQATWGKRRTLLAVAGPGRQRIGLGRSLARTALKFIPWELAHFTIWQYSFLEGAGSTFLDACLVAVWVLVGANIASLVLSPTHQTLYDRLAKTTVVYDA